MNKKPQLGILKYIGRTHFADGEWCGILLDEPCGKNDGSVRGVRYFRCRNKHGIFVHSHKVKCADDTTLSKLNLLEGFSSPESSEKQDYKLTIDTEPRMASIDDEIANGNITVHRDVKSLRLTKRNRSVSLDRYLFLKTKQLAKGLNILKQSTDKGDKVDTWEQNRINRSVSLPKIGKESDYDSNEFCLSSEMVPLEKKPWLGEKEGQIANGVDKGDPSKARDTTDLLCSSENDMNSSNRCKEIELVCSENSPPEDSLDKSTEYHAHANQNVTNGGTATHKVGHAVSLDTHLMIEKGQLTVTTNGNNEEFSCQSHLVQKEDPFIQGRHCSCPSLHCVDHFSEAITTCLDLGRTERSVIHEGSRENDTGLGAVNAAGFPYNHEIHAHSQSEALEKLIHKVKVARSKSYSSRDPELARKASWPWLTSTPKQSLRSYGSSDDINASGTFGSEDIFDEGFSSISAHVKLISGNTVDKDLNSKSMPSTGADIISVSKVVDSLSTETGDRQAIDTDSNYADSLSGSQASLSSTGTSDSKGKKTSTKKRIVNSAKGSGSKPKSNPSSFMSTPKATQKQSRLEQIRQQQQNRRGPLPSAVNKSQLADKSGHTNTENKLTKRNTLATIPDTKSFVPRPSISKRPTSDGMAGNAEKSVKEEAKSKLPVKKMSMPSLISRPTALPKHSDTGTTVQRQQSAAASRPPAAPIVKRNSSVARSDSKTRKSSSVAQKSAGKEKELSVVGQKIVGGQTSTPAKGSKGVTATGPKPQTSRVARSSSSAKGNSIDFLC